MSKIDEGGDVSKSICIFCQNYTYGATCKAYPSGIPEEILNNTVSHILPYKNDNGIVFKKKNIK